MPRRSKWKRKPKPKPAAPPTVTCPYCNNAAQLVTGREIYPHRRDLFRLKFWQCAPCEAYVGCHKGGDGMRPLGLPANPETRKARNVAHAVFDPIWKEGHMKRFGAYHWLSQQLGLPIERTHIGEFDVAMCQRVVEACAKLRAELTGQSW